MAGKRKLPRAELDAWLAYDAWEARGEASPSPVPIERLAPSVGGLAVVASPLVPRGYAYVNGTMFPIASH